MLQNFKIHTQVTFPIKFLLEGSINTFLYPKLLSLFKTLLMSTYKVEILPAFLLFKCDL